MKNKIMYLIAVLIAASVCFSCSDDDNKDEVPAEFTGTWKFDKTHFVFDYKEASITIPSIGTLPVTVVKPLIEKTANDKMKAYFTGIRFDSNKQLTILMKMNEQDATLDATYEVQGSIINVSLNKEQLGALVGQDLAFLPAISLKYNIGAGNLTMYLDKAYIQTLVAGISVLLPQLMPDATDEEREALKQTINTIMGNTQQLEIGALLVR